MEKKAPVLYSVAPYGGCLAVPIKTGEVLEKLLGTFSVRKGRAPNTECLELSTWTWRAPYVDVRSHDLICEHPSDLNQR